MLTYLVASLRDRSLSASASYIGSELGFIKTDSLLYGNSGLDHLPIVVEEIRTIVAPATAATIGANAAK